MKKRKFANVIRAGKTLGAVLHKRFPKPPLDEAPKGDDFHKPKPLRVLTFGG